MGVDAAPHARCADLARLAAGGDGAAGIEGFELPTLQGGEALIAACQPTLILEHHNRQAELLDWLRAIFWR